MNFTPPMVLATFASKSFICLFIYFMWRWSLFNGAESSSMAHLVRFRNKAITIGLLGCMGLGLLSFVSLSSPMARLAPLIGLSFYFTYLQMDPTKVGYWHHKRMRPLGVILGLIGALILGAFTFDLALSGLFFATIIFHRHQKFSRMLVKDQLRNQELLRKKILCLEADCVNLGTRAELNRLANPQIASLVPSKDLSFTNPSVPVWRTPNDSPLEKS